MDEEKKDNMLTGIGYILLIIVILLSNYTQNEKITDTSLALQGNFDSMLSSRDSEIIMLKGTLQSVADEFTEMRKDVGRLKYEMQEMWFSRVNKDVKKAMYKKIDSVGCRSMDYSLQNTYYGMLDVKDFEYLKLDYPNGVLIFDTTGKFYCFNGSSSPVETDCFELCGPVIKENITEG